MPFLVCPLNSCLILDLNSIEEADIPHCTIATLGKSEKITLIQVGLVLAVCLWTV